MATAYREPLQTLLETLKELQVIAQVAGHKKVLPDALATGSTEVVGQTPVAEKLSRSPNAFPG